MIHSIKLRQLIATKKNLSLPLRSLVTASGAYKNGNIIINNNHTKQQEQEEQVLATFTGLHPLASHHGSNLGVSPLSLGMGMGAPGLYRPLHNTAFIKKAASMVAIDDEEEEEEGIEYEYEPKKSFFLPSERAKYNVEGQGWKVDTTVKTSLIPGAGAGRFSDVDVPKNKIIMVKPMVQMSEIPSIHSIANDEVIVFKNKDEVERFIHLYEKEGRQSRKDIIDCLAHFIWTLKSIEGVTLNFSTWSMNHGNPNDGENVRFIEDDGLILGVSVTDIKAGDELLNDYRDFDPMDDFWIQYCKDEGVKDVVTNLRQYVDL